jgi:hypothetical protein
MTERGAGTGDVEIRIPASCLAEFVTSSGRSPQALLRPYKFNRKGEGFVRARYYQPALKVMRAYHMQKNDPDVFYRARLEFQRRADTSSKRGQQKKYENNIAALDAYQQACKSRKLVILTARRFEYGLGPITVTAEPDLWVEEGKRQIVLKVGIARKNRTYIDALLTIFRKAAVASGYRIRAENFVYLDVASGKELTCKTSLAAFNQTFRSSAEQIAKVWPDIQESTSTSRARRPKPAA